MPFLKAVDGANATGNRYIRIDVEESTRKKKDCSIEKVNVEYFVM